MASSQRTWIEISSSAIRHNLKAMRQVVGKHPAILPIIKANAYGHGTDQLLSILQNQPIAGLGVAYGSEALALRKKGYSKRIIVLSAWELTELKDLLKQKIEIVVWDLASLAQVMRTVSQREIAKIHLKLDTGTTRIGFRQEDVGSLQKPLKGARSHVQVVGVFSHLANSEELKRQRTQQQLHRFATLSKFLNPFPGERHLACTAAALRYPKSRFDLIRLGIGLFGLWPSPEIKNWATRSGLRYHPKPSLSWYSHLQQVKLIPPGTSIGYGSTVTARKRMRIGIIPVGYSDGYPRSASNRGYVMVSGKPADIVGRISMNLMAVNLRNQPRARPGDQVTLIGQSIDAQTLAERSDSLHYEIVSRISAAIPRRVVA